MEPTRDRRAAHERLSTGTLARWTRICATHPWRVVLGFLATVAVLIALVATVGGGLRDEFDIPGSDTQKATDLIEAEFAAEQGASSTSSSRAPQGERLDTPERKAAIQRAIARLKSPSSSRPTTRSAWRASVIRSARTRSPTTGALRTPKLSSTRSSSKRIAKRCSRSRTPSVRPPSRGSDRRVQRRRRVPTDRAGNGGTARPAHGAHRAARRLPHVRGDVDPDRTGAHGPGRRSSPVHHRRPDHDQHDHADPARLDDRSGRRDRLLVIHRHPLQAAPSRGAHRRTAAAEAGASAGRAVRLCRADGCHLGQRPGPDRAGLRHEARHRQRPGRADDGADRKLAALACSAAWAQDRPSQGAVHPSDRRLGCRPRQDDRRALGSVRDRSRAGRVRGLAARAGPRGDVRARSTGRGRPGDAAQGADEPAGPTTCSPRGSGRASTAPSRSSWT